MRRGITIAAFTTATLVLAGCRTNSPSRELVAFPDQFHLAVDSFRISSSFPLNEDDPLALELVELRRAVQTTLGLGDTERHTEIYIFDDRAQYDRFIQTYYPGLPRRRAFFIAQGEREVVYAFRDEKLIEDLRHEACHALLHSAYGTVPLWLDEGLAEYFETPGTGGGLHPRHIIELQSAVNNGWKPSLTRLESLTQLPQMTARDYREAWCWVYWLIQESPQSRALLLQYLADIRDGVAREPLSNRVFATSPRADQSLVTFVSRAKSPPPVTLSIGSAGEF